MCLAVATKFRARFGDFEPADNPAGWKIFKVYVGETALPLNRPKS